MSKLEFCEASQEDIPKIVKLLKETILEVYGQILPRDRLEPWIEGDRLESDVNQIWQKMIVAQLDDEIVALAASLEDKVAIIWVHPAHHRNGIGSALLDIVEAEIRNSGYEKATLDCFSDNHKALCFYQAKGWKILSPEMDEYAGAMKTIMTKTLNAN
jgi:ribosomal protein S18 acetylase RimI-like enzyme